MPFDPVVSGLFCSGVEGFEEFYRPELANLCDRGTSLLMHVLLDEKDSSVRSRLANRLLDDGADPRKSLASGYGVIHALCANRGLDPEKDAVLMRRLIAAGADVNARDSRDGAPLVALINRPRRNDDLLMPIYRVFLEQPDLDVDVVDGFGISVLDTVRIQYARYPKLCELVEDYERAHGRAVEHPLWFLASSGSYEQFISGYDVTRVREVTRNSSLLMWAIENPDPVARGQIARRLIADGADLNFANPNYGTTAMRLVIQASDLGSAENLELFKLLLDAGADLSLERGGAAESLALLARDHERKPELNLDGYYDLLLARDDLDLLTPGWRKRNVLDVVRDRSDQSDGLTDRLVAWLEGHGLEVPPYEKESRSRRRRRR